MVRARLHRERAARLEAERIAEEALADLWASNQDLDARVRERTASLREALTRAKAAEKAKDAFLTGVAHRTGSPLHAIQGFIELVGRERGDGPLHDAAVRAIEETRRLSRAFEALLELSEAVSGPIMVNAHPIRIGRWGDVLLARWIPETVRRGRLLEVTFDAPPSLEVVIDAERMHQVTDPLIANALEHGAGAIGVAISLSQAQLRVTVCDDGDGVPADLALSMFDAFVSAHGPRGFGVGLTVSRTVARAMGGDVVHLAEAGRTTFQASVPTPPSGPTGHRSPPTYDTDDTDEGAVTVDVEVLRRLEEEVGSTDVLLRLIEAFTGNVDVWVGDLTSGDQPVRRRAAHSLVSSTAQLGMAGLSAIARRVERGDDERDLALLLTGLRSSTRALHQALNQGLR